MPESSHNPSESPMVQIETSETPPTAPIHLIPMDGAGRHSNAFVYGHSAGSLIGGDRLARIVTWAEKHASTCDDDTCSMNEPMRAITGICSALLCLPDNMGKARPGDEGGAPIAQVAALLYLRSQRAGYRGVVDYQTVAHALGIIGWRGEPNSHACAIPLADLHRLEVLVMLETAFGALRPAHVREQIKRRAHHVVGDKEQPIAVRAAAMRAICRMHFERSAYTTDMEDARLVLGAHPSFSRYARAYDNSSIRAHPDVLAVFRAEYPLEPSLAMPFGRSYWDCCADED